MLLQCNTKKSFSRGKKSIELVLEIIPANSFEAERCFSLAGWFICNFRYSLGEESIDFTRDLTIECTIDLTIDLMFLKALLAYSRKELHGRES